MVRARRSPNTCCHAGSPGKQTAHGRASRSDGTLKRSFADRLPSPAMTSPVASHAARMRRANWKSQPLSSAFDRHRRSRQRSRLKALVYSGSRKRFGFSLKPLVVKSQTVKKEEKKAPTNWIVDLLHLRSFRGGKMEFYLREVFIQCVKFGSLHSKCLRCWALSVLTQEGSCINLMFILNIAL